MIQQRTKRKNLKPPRVYQDRSFEDVLPTISVRMFKQYYSTATILFSAVSRQFFGPFTQKTDLTISYILALQLSHTFTSSLLMSAPDYPGISSRNVAPQPVLSPPPKHHCPGQQPDHLPHGALETKQVPHSAATRKVLQLGYTYLHTTFATSFSPSNSPTGRKALHVPSRSVQLDPQ